MSWVRFRRSTYTYSTQDYFELFLSFESDFNAKYVKPPDAQCAPSLGKGYKNFWKIFLAAFGIRTWYLESLSLVLCQLNEMISHFKNFSKSIVIIFEWLNVIVNMVRQLQGKILKIIQIGIYKNLCNSKSNNFHHLSFWYSNVWVLSQKSCFGGIEAPLSTFEIHRFEKWLFYW